MTTAPAGRQPRHDADHAAFVRLGDGRRLVQGRRRAAGRYGRGLAQQGARLAAARVLLGVSCDSVLVGGVVVLDFGDVVFGWTAGADAAANADADEADAESPVRVRRRTDKRAKRQQTSSVPLDTGDMAGRQPSSLLCLLQMHRPSQLLDASVLFVLFQFSKF